ncbi:hypothetical protein TNCV_1714851 [Trichonephila clavipes]|nr:hypothetical protein TNCV_1714851 [Trichonephila clavipes]
MALSGSLPQINLGVQDSDENIRFKESHWEEPDESANVTDNVPVNTDIHVTRSGTEWILHISNVSGKFAIRNVLRESSGPTSFTKHYVNTGNTKLHRTIKRSDKIRQSSKEVDQNYPIAAQSDTAYAQDSQSDIRICEKKVVKGIFF